MMRGILRLGTWPLGLKPNFVIGGAHSPYLRRWWLLPRNRWCNLYLHHFLRSDDDRALHDHPWWNVSILLRGWYIEHTPGGRDLRRPGRPVFRAATAAHRIELCSGVAGEMPVWSLFLTGPRVREWGFLCPRGSKAGGWRHWRDFTNPDDGGASIGRGCE